MLNSEFLSHVGGNCQPQKSSQQTILSRKQWFKNVISQQWDVLLAEC